MDAALDNTELEQYLMQLLRLLGPASGAAGTAGTDDSPGSGAAGENAGREQALADQKVRAALEGKQIVKVIVVSGKLVNIIVR